MRTSLPFTPEGFTQTPGLGPPKVLHAAAWGHWGGTRQTGKQTRAFQGFNQVDPRGLRQAGGMGTGDGEATSSDGLAQVLCQP